MKNLKKIKIYQNGSSERNLSKSLQKSSPYTKKQTNSLLNSNNNP